MQVVKLDTNSVVAHWRNIHNTYMAAAGDVMNLTYIDRDMTTVKLLRCPGSPRAPDPANPLEKMLKPDKDQDQAAARQSP